MSDQNGLLSELNEEATPLPADQTAEPQIAGSKKPHESDSIEDRKTFEDRENDGELKEKEEEEVISSAHLEPSTLPWPGDKHKRPQTDNDDKISSEKGVSESEDEDTGIGGESQELYEEQSQAESDKKVKAKWRESMPEGERWRSDEIEVQRDDKGDGSLADDEDEGDDDEEEEGESNWISEKAALGFTPQVTIVRPASRELPAESRLLIENNMEKEPQMEPDSVQYYPDWREQDDKYYLCDHVCSEKLRVALALVAAGLLFPLLVWGGYAFLPFDSPLLQGAPLRVVYTLRCSFFATIPILLARHHGNLHQPGPGQAGATAHHRIRFWQADLLALPLPGQQHQRLRLRLVVLPHTDHAGRQPLLRLRVSRTDGGFRRGTAHNTFSSKATLLGLKGEETRNKQLQTPFKYHDETTLGHLGSVFRCFSQVINDLFLLALLQKEMCDMQQVVSALEA